MLPTVDLALYCSLGLLTIIMSSLVAFAFISSKELRQHPSGLLVAISICEVVMAYHTIIFVYDNEGYVDRLKLNLIFALFTNSQSESLRILCRANNIIIAASTIACICYNIAVCLDLIITLYNPLVTGSIRKKWYHSLTALATTYFTIYIYFYSEFIDECRSNEAHRLEIMNTGSVNILLSIYLAIAILSIIYAAVRFAAGLKLECSTMKSYLRRHVAYVAIFVFCWAWPAASYLLKRYHANKQTTDTIDHIAIASK
jgi:hypothetical protein